LCIPWSWGVSRWRGIAVYRITFKPGQRIQGIPLKKALYLDANLADKPSNLSLRTLSRETYLDGINKSKTTKVSAVNSSTVYLMV
jgi:hypothetical protein